MTNVSLYLQKYFNNACIKYDRPQPKVLCNILYLSVIFDNTKISIYFLIVLKYLC